MSRLSQYADRYANAKLFRSDTGVLEVTFHTDGGKLVFNGYTHEQFTDLFHQIGEDPDNRVVILTGSGDAFMDAIAPDGFDFFTPSSCMHSHRGDLRLSNPDWNEQPIRLPILRGASPLSVNCPVLDG